MKADKAGRADELRRFISSNQQQIDALQNTIAVSDALIVSGEGTPKVVAFVPKSTKLQDPANGQEQEAIQRARAFASGLAAEGAESGAPAYARHVMRAATSERGARQRGEGTEKHDAETGLIEMFASLLGSDVRFVLNDSQNLQIDGLTDRYDGLLSDGQKVLFQLACMLHARGGRKPSSESGPGTARMPLTPPPPKNVGCKKPRRWRRTFRRMHLPWILLSVLICGHSR